MSNFGSVTFEGKLYILTQDADYTNRVFPGWFGDAQDGETYTTEFSAAAIDENGDKCRVFWQFEEIRGQEREDSEKYDWSNVAFVRHE